MEIFFHIAILYILFYLITVDVDLLHFPWWHWVFRLFLYLGYCMCAACCHSAPCDRGYWEAFSINVGMFCSPSLRTGPHSLHFDADTSPSFTQITLHCWHQLLLVQLSDVIRYDSGHSIAWRRSEHVTCVPSPNLRRTLADPELEAVYVMCHRSKPRFEVETDLVTISGFRAAFFSLIARPVTTCFWILWDIQLLIGPCSPPSYIVLLTLIGWFWIEFCGLFGPCCVFLWLLPGSIIFIYDRLTWGWFIMWPFPPYWLACHNQLMSFLIGLLWLYVF